MQLIPAELNHPAKLGGELSLPMRRRVTAFPFPLFLGTLRIITAFILCFFFIAEAICPTNNGTHIFLLFLFSVFYLYEATTNLFLIADAMEGYPSIPALAEISRFFLVLKWLLAAIRFVCFPALNIFSCCSFVALLVNFVVEKSMRERSSSHYDHQFKVLEEVSMKELEEMFGTDHELDQRVPGELVTVSSDIEAKFWKGVEVEERIQSIVPILLYSKQNEDSNTEFFIEWISYTTITEGFKIDYVRMCELAEKCNELRSDLMKQNELITQCREKLYGANADKTDIEEIPSKTLVPASWIQERADCIFTYSKGETNLYVNLVDFREMAQYAFVVKDSIPRLENEQVVLKKGINKRNLINNELLRTILNGEFMNKDDFVIL